jgi:hypothetical protein
MNAHYSALVHFINMTSPTQDDSVRMLAHLDALYSEASQHASLAELVDQFLAAAVVEAPMSLGDSLIEIVEASHAEA